ncbi:hypothetical protein [Cumulibacter soli]|nr:hypothetical protein [Cumulibacter soli]
MGLRCLGMEQAVLDSLRRIRANLMIGVGSCSGSAVWVAKDL